MTYLIICQDNYFNCGSWAACQQAISSAQEWLENGDVCGKG